jgi:hypothetical protein
VFKPVVDVDVPVPRCGRHRLGVRMLMVLVIGVPVLVGLRDMVMVVLVKGAT